MNNVSKTKGHAIFLEMLPFLKKLSNERNLDLHVNQQAITLKNGEWNSCITIVINRSHKGYNSLHFQLSLFHDQISSLYTSLIEKTVKDPEFDYPIPVDTEVLALFKKNHSIIQLTDWQNWLLDHDIEDNDYWLCTFNSLQDLTSWQEKFSELIDLGLMWFKTKQDLNRCVLDNINKKSTHGLQIAICIWLVQNTDTKLIVSKVEDYKSKLKLPDVIDWNQIDVFLKYI